MSPIDKEGRENQLKTQELFLEFIRYTKNWLDKEIERLGDMQKDVDSIQRINRETFERWDKNREKREKLGKERRKVLSQLEEMFKNNYEE